MDSADPRSVRGRTWRSVFAMLLVRSGLILVLSDSPLPAEEKHPQLLRRIAFGSCAEQFKSQPIWDAVVEQRPDLFLFLGDNIYADTEDMSVMQAKYAQLGAQPGYQKLWKSCPVLATWDDHDYGVNDGGAWYPKKVESQQIMLDFFQVPKDSMRRKRQGVYGTFVFGPPGKRVQVILLDTRYFKSRHTKDTRPEDEKKKLNLVGWYVPNRDPETTILGAEQWKWLEAQLKEPAEVRIIASSIQVIADEKGMESWGNFPHERQRLYDLIGKTKAQGVLFLSGDVHFTEISASKDGPYPLYDFTSSSLSEGVPEWASAVNRFRVSARAYALPTFGLVEIDWEQTRPTLTLRAHGEKGELAFENQVKLSP
ncbi:MAG: alkaline phosphatase family protein [Planctomycetaceae bacterium]|nr:alkaline phosphatase family protein [Planctomycetaceae bacterium]